MKENPHTIQVYGQRWIKGQILQMKKCHFENPIEHRPIQGKEQNIFSSTRRFSIYWILMRRPMIYRNEPDGEVVTLFFTRKLTFRPAPEIAYLFYSPF